MRKYKKKSIKGNPGKDSNGNKVNNTYYKTNLLLKVCEDEYFRIINFYIKIFDKVNITLVFLAALLTVVTKQVDFHYLFILKEKITHGEIIVSLMIFFCQVLSFLLFLFSLIGLILLLKGEKIRVLNTDNIFNILYVNEKEIDVNKWLIEQYLNCISENSTAMKKKQIRFNRILKFICIGVILWLLSILLQGVV